MKDLSARMNVMSDEIEKFKNLRQLQDSADATKEYLVEMRDGYTQNIALLDKLLKEISPQYEEKVKRLDNATWKNLTELKEKLREQGQTLFDLQEEVKKMRSKTDFSGTKSACMQLVDEINTSIIANLQ